MTETSQQFDRSLKLSTNIAKVLARRAESALKEYRAEVERIAKAQVEVAQKQWSNPLQFWTDGYRYAVDFAQRYLKPWQRTLQAAYALADKSGKKLDFLNLRSR